MVVSELITNAWTSLSEKTSELLTKLEDVPYYDVFRNNKVLVITTSVAGLGIIRYLWRPRNLPPGPFGLPVVGALREISNDTHLDYERMRKKYGDIFCFYVGSKLHVVISSDELIREALVKRGDEFSDRPVEDIAGIQDEIFSCKCTENFKHVKKVSMQALKAHVLDSKKLEESTQQNSSYVINILLKMKGKPFDIRDTLVNASSNVIYNLVFNDSFDFDNPKLKDFIDRAHEYNAATFADEVKWTYYAKYILPTFLKNLIFRKTEAEQDQRVEYFIELAASQYREHMKTLDPNSPRDYVDSVLIARSESEIREMAKSTSVFIPDATDSVADLARCCLYHFCLYPEELKTIQRKIDDVCGTRVPTLQNRAQLSYIEAFIWEVMRTTCFSPVLQPHSPCKDTQLAGYNIPKGSFLWCNVYPVYKDPKIFKDPEKFNPGRFLDASGKLANTGLSYPMGMGRRTCMGKELVKAEVFLILACLTQRMNFKFADPKNVPPLSYLGPFLAETPRFELIATER